MRLLVLAVCVFGVAAPAAGQKEHSDLGFQLGYSRARFSGDQSGIGESRTGSLFGAFIGTPLAGPLNVQAEIFLAKKGGGLSTTIAAVPVQVSVQLIYLEVPLLARIVIPVGGRLHPNVFGGGSVALNVGCDIQAEVPGLVSQEACDEAGTLQVNTFDLGAVVGAGVEYDWRKSNARLEIRQTFGLREVAPGGLVKNRVWAILFGITL
ncbi:MAG TPA: porin family protein [Gemmatimonadales bacterium]|nr:porin family protein [Gemmatimonadales bacterium]